MSDEKHQIGLQPYLSQVADWALSVGTAVGWIVDVTIIGDTVLYGLVSKNAGLSRHFFRLS